ncbi:uncharacterized protein LOC127122135 [Lathyrus oleraceus]|uniref:uncharacterized protein LOC127122135 n=1 Tax=Pisum sativum TaxID=3888 RepID=UPI0021D04DA6|nr:uncharacterized protein LOC127122135 [Pisum sativum]
MFCYEILQDDIEFIKALKEVHVWGSGLTLTDEEIKELTFIVIETQLQKNNRVLKDFESMSYPNDFILSFVGNRLVYEERKYDPIAQKHIFDTLFSSLTGEEKENFSSDSIDRPIATDFDAFEHLTLEFLNALKTSRFPNHSIKLKIGATIMLMCNLDQSEDLCNGTRLTVTRFANHVIEAKITSGKNIGEKFEVKLKIHVTFVTFIFIVCKTWLFDDDSVETGFMVCEAPD